MKHTSVIISTYTADVSGVCSALYELGGMVVIHDPSGCNSTYNTHDEPRWYDQDSLIFISGLSEMDAIMGNDDKLIGDIVRAAGDLSPRFIALVRAPVPMMTGVDFEAIRYLVEKETGIPTWYFPTDGMHSYIQGVNMALAAVAKHMVLDAETSAQTKVTPLIEGSGQSRMTPLSESSGHIKVNLLGVTPLDFSVGETLPSIRRMAYDHGYRIQSCLAMGSSYDEIAGAGKARVNLVLSSAGIDAARVLKERFGTPYVVGLPTGAFAEIVFAAMADSLESGRDHIVYQEPDFVSAAQQESCKIGHSTKLVTKKLSLIEDNRFLTRQKEGRIYLIGEAVTAGSVREAARLEYGLDLKVLCGLETPRDLLDEGCETLLSEEEMQKRLADADVVIADPLYRPICPENVSFIPFPHEAFSGRIYRDRIPDLTRPEQIIYNHTG